MRFSGVFFGLYCLCSAHQVRAQWEIQDAHTTASLRGIHYVGNGVAWASGTDGTVLRTEDMGFVWQLCTIPPGAEKLDFRGIQAFDNNTAVVMSSGKGDLSRLYKTTDGCQTWKLVFTNPDKDGFWDALAMRDANQGWLLGDPSHGHFNVLTLNLLDKQNPVQPDCVQIERWRAGSSAKCFSSLAAEANESAAFAASNSAFFDLQHAYRAMSRGGPPPLQGEEEKYMQWENFPSFVTGGKAGAKWCTRHLFYEMEVPAELGWDCEVLPLGSKTETSGAFSISLNAAGRAVVVGGDFEKPNAREYTSAHREPSFGSEAQTRARWTESSNPPNGYRSSVDFDRTAKTWVIVGPNGTDISTDDGRNWHSLKPGPGDAPDADQHWNALSLPFVVGPKGRIGLMHDGALKGAATRSQ